MVLMPISYIYNLKYSSVISSSLYCVNIYSILYSDLYNCCLANSDCAEAIKSIKTNYVELTDLPIDAILRHLYAKEVITARDKEMIKTLQLKADKMEYFLDYVITSSLQSSVTVKFKRFLEVMEESGDPVFTKMAVKLGNYYYCIKIS